MTSLSFDSAVKTGPPRFPPPTPHTLGTDWRAPSAAAGFREIQMHGNLPILVGVLRTSLVSQAASITI